MTDQELTELAEVLYNFMKDGIVDYNNIKETIQSFLLANHYVRLAKDQTLPDINLPTLTGNKSLEIAMESFAKSIQQNLFKEGWRRIILEVKE